MSEPRHNFEIVLISVCLLFVELLIIRWLGSEVSVFAYLQNTILITCFMGIGLGCLTSKRRVRPSDVIIPLLALVLLLTLPLTRKLLFQLSFLLSSLGDLLAWNFGLRAEGMNVFLYPALGLAITFLIMFLVWQVFVPMGRILGALLAQHPRPLIGYGANILGSLIGVWLFVECAAISTPPLVWLIVFEVVFSYFVIKESKGRAISLFLSGVILILAGYLVHPPQGGEIVWSPYQKLELSPLENGSFVIAVNNTSFQSILDLRKPVSGSEVQRAAYISGTGVSSYDLPFVLKPDTRAMLVVGAGAGNDVAAGLRHGVEKITAVEIDPAVISFGKRYHPEQPYRSSRVTLINDDARAFFSNGRGFYDLISFGLLDSHTMTGMTNVRLDNFVYTMESLNDAKARLAPGGLVTLTFWVPIEFIFDRFYWMLSDVFGEPPLVLHFGQSGKSGPIMFISGDLTALRSRIDASPELTSLVKAGSAAGEAIAPSPFIERVTDDWPYLYHRERAVPPMYQLLTLMLAALFVLATSRAHAIGVLREWDRNAQHFMFLGAAFLLLEVHNINKAALVLGNTWQVNAVVISGVLGMAFAATVLTSIISRGAVRTSTYLLLVSCFGLYFVDFSIINALSYPMRATAVAIFMGLPMLFSGILFADSFKATTHRDRALGANLMGAMLGTVLQMASFAFGLRALLLIVFALYVGAVGTAPKKLQ